MRGDYCTSSVLKQTHPLCIHVIFAPESQLEYLLAPGVNPPLKLGVGIARLLCILSLSFFKLTRTTFTFYITSNLKCLHACSASSRFLPHRTSHCFWYCVLTCVDSFQENNTFLNIEYTWFVFLLLEGHCPCFLLMAFDVGIIRSGLARSSFYIRFSSSKK